MRSLTSKEGLWLFLLPSSHPVHALSCRAELQKRARRSIPQLKRSNMYTRIGLWVAGWGACR